MTVLFEPDLWSAFLIPEALKENHGPRQIAQRWPSLLIFRFCIRLGVKLNGCIGHNHCVKMGSLSFSKSRLNDLINL
jgi:hypothetical protein